MMSGRSSYVRDAWYMAGWEQEIQGNALFSRTLLDRARLIFRKSDDSGYVMMDDMCPHRFAPLSKGKRDGDRVACGYHGLTFDAAGHCVHNPFSAKIPPRASVATLPIVARHSILWFWPGDAALANPDAIPDFSFLDLPTSRRTIRMNANYELLTDNLMDLSHVEFIHANSFNMGGAMFSATQKVIELKDGGIRSDWWMENVPAGFNPYSLAPETRVDRWLDSCWYAPSSMWLEVGMTLRGTARSESPGPAMKNPHIVTPETEASSHYFYTCVPGLEEFADRVFLTEDKPMLEAIQHALGDRDFWSMNPAVLTVDGGALRARARLKQLREREVDRENGHSAERPDLKEAASPVSQ